MKPSIYAHTSHRKLDRAINIIEIVEHRDSNTEREASLYCVLTESHRKSRWICPTIAAGAFTYVSICTHGFYILTPRPRRVLASSFGQFDLTHVDSLLPIFFQICVH